MASTFETRPGNATKAYDIGGYEWGDDSWLQWRKNHLPYSSPVNIYECHLGSWKMHEDGNFIPTASSRTSSFPMSRKWATRISSSCR